MSAERPKTSPNSSSISRRIRSKLAKRSFSEGTTDRLNGMLPRSHETVLIAEDHRLGAVAEVELLEDPSDVGLHRRLAQKQLLRDFGVRAAAPERPQHLQLTLSQLRRRLRACGRARHEVLDQPARDLGREQRLTGRDHSDRLKQA